MNFPIRTSRKTKKLCNDFVVNKYNIMKDYGSALRIYPGARAQQ